ncbi:MAG: type II toxin-antitoxin system ParD family antitoxin [Acidobacteria bacterium]|nr:type II toxin-antitoxin system ParD family antitoxin [Acidobacteriota bacterium]
MNVSLTPELERLVSQKVSSGMYQTASEVVREALRLLSERDQRKLAELRQDLQRAVDQVERGEHEELDERAVKSLARQVKARGRRALRGADRLRRQ